MTDLSRISALVAGAASYLLLHRLCDEDHLPHGRRSYVWPLLAWLYRHDHTDSWLEKAKTVGDDLLPTVRRNHSGETVIFPGLHHRRNYSTNAIDCGTFVDSYFDFASLSKPHPHPIDALVRDVAETYLVRKITGHKDVHDQYLWAATGLARFLSEHEHDARAPEFRSALESTLDFWVSHHERDGYSPYMRSDPFMGGLTPYYFSRRIAFAWYILEKARLRRPDIEQRLVTAARFLATLLRPDGTKEMLLEAKRYYFWGSFEADSHPFDLYVYYKTYTQTGEEIWLDYAAASLMRLLESQTENGAIRSRATEAVRDWQCDTMRTGHVAWLTRIPDGFWALVSNQNGRPLRLPPAPVAVSPESRVWCVGSGEHWVHFVARKGQIAGHAGERVSGIVIPTGVSVTDLLRPALFQYRARSNPALFLKHNRRAIVATFQYAFFHVWDCFYHKRSYALAWAFLRDSLVGYLITGFFTRSTEFATEVEHLSVKEGDITHDLVLADTGGHQRETIGTRHLWVEGNSLQIEDTITAAFPVRLELKSGSTIVHGPRSIRIVYKY